MKQARRDKQGLRKFLPPRNLDGLLQAARQQFQLSRLRYGPPQAPVLLTVVTRTWNRTTSLKRCVQTATQLQVPPDTAWEHVILQDRAPGGSGMLLAETALHAFCEEFRGDYVCHMDDDNHFLALDLLYELQAVRESEGVDPPAIVVKCRRSDDSVLPLYWHSFPTYDGSIDTCNVWFRKDLYRKRENTGAAALPHAGDYALIHNLLLDCRYEDVAWLDRVVTCVGDYPLQRDYDAHYVTAELVGGLGNQLFQVAAAFRYADVHHEETELGQRVAFVHRQGTTHPEGDTRRTTYWDSLLSQVPQFPQHFDPTAAEWQALKEPGFLPRPWPLLYGHVRLHGYWQAWCHVSPQLPRLRRLVAQSGVTPAALTDPQVRLETALAIHVRRGDYLSNPQHPVQTLEYYRKAYAHCRERHAGKPVVLFTDDREWCRDHLVPLLNELDPEVRCCFTDPTSADVEDLVALTRCAAHVIANSSFSWWGAALAPPPADPSDQPPCVVAPRQWFNPEAGGQIRQWDCLYAPHWKVV